jgi:hypothetical protein
MKRISNFSLFFTLFGHTKYIEMRKNREAYAIEKLRKAKKAASILQYIPSVLFVGITGGLSMLNADEDDDIDFYICTKKGTVWVTRFFSTLLIEGFCVRRKPGEQEVKDAICLNMFVSEDALGVPKSERDIYTAHEVLQLLPVWERGNMYSMFLRKNNWVSLLFPNRWSAIKKRTRDIEQASCPQLLSKIIVWFFCLFEQYVKLFQLWYMRKRQTTEVLSDSIIRFHPKDARIWIHALLKEKIKTLHLPLDKKIFHP